MNLKKSIKEAMLLTAVAVFSSAYSIGKDLNLLEYQFYIDKAQNKGDYTSYEKLYRELSHHSITGVRILAKGALFNLYQGKCYGQNLSNSFPFLQIQDGALKDLYIKRCLTFLDQKESLDMLESIVEEMEKEKEYFEIYKSDMEHYLELISKIYQTGIPEMGIQHDLNKAKKYKKLYSELYR